MIRTTLIGGAIFLVPVVFLLYIFAEAYKITSRLAEKLSPLLPFDSIAGLALVNILAILLIFVICFLAGLAAQHSFLARKVEQIESILVEFFPGFAIAKSMASGMAGKESGPEAFLKTVLVTFDDHEAIGFEVERTENRVIVFLPGAPSAWSGNSVSVPPDRVTPLNLPVHKVSGLLRTLGRGTVAAVQKAGVEGQPPRS